MVSKEKFIIVYSVGDGFTYSAEETVAVEAESKLAFLQELELCLCAFEPGTSPELFVCGGQTFRYDAFMTYYEDNITPRRVIGKYDYHLPEVHTFEEWAAISFQNGKRGIEYQTKNTERRQRAEDFLSR